MKSNSAPTVPHPKRNVITLHKQTLIDEFLLGEASHKAVQTLYTILCDDKQAGGVRVAAANSLLDRAGYTSKRHEPKDTSLPDLQQMTPAQLRQALAELDKQLVDITPIPTDGAPVSEPMTSEEIDSYE